MRDNFICLILLMTQKQIVSSYISDSDMKRTDFGWGESVTPKFKYNNICDPAITFLFPPKKMESRGSHKKLYETLAVETMILKKDKKEGNHFPSYMLNKRCHINSVEYYSSIKRSKC